MIVSEKHGYVFIQQAHTACTAVGRELVEHYDGKSILHKHATYRHFLKWAGGSASEYFVFSAIRNPMDEVVSIYHKFKTNHQGDYSNPKNLKKNGGWLSPRGLRQFQFIHQPGIGFAEYFRAYFRLPYVNTSVVGHDRLDFVIRFEYLQEDFAEALKRLGLPQVRPLPVINKTKKMDGEYVDFYPPELRRQAVWVFGPLMKRWGYTFPQEWQRTDVPAMSRLTFHLVSKVRQIYWRHLA